MFVIKWRDMRETVGKLSWDLLANASVLDHSAEEQMREQLNLYESNMFEAIERGKKLYPKDFYIVVETKKEPKMKNVIRNYFIPRQSCPTPQYDEAVYQYNHLSDSCEFLWVLPSRDVYNMMKNNPLEIPKEERQLLQFVLEDADGTLLNKCKKLNGEIEITK
jgi:hypothetical protein